MKVYLASDHAAFEAKESLKDYLNEEFEIEDLGTDSAESTHYPIYSQKCAEAVAANPKSKGVLLCGSGIGASMVANRTKGVRAALCRTVWDAQMSRLHNNANIIVFGGRVSSLEDMKKMIDVFFSTEFEGGRHQTRIDMF